MGGAMLRRWDELELCSEIQVIEPSDPKALPAPDALPAAFSPDVVIYAVKPQILPEILPDYARFSHALHLSIAAGKKISFFENILSEKTRLIRAMPNTPAAIGQGVSVACPNKHATTHDRETAEKLLSAVGKCLWTDKEEDMNAVTALSGSGPAYVFLLIECMTAAGIANGLTPEMSAVLARETVIGSAALAAAESWTSPETLRRNVTSPGGTTEAALKVLMSDEQLLKLMTSAITAARKRAEELAS